MLRSEHRYGHGDECRTTEYELVQTVGLRRRLPKRDAYT